MSGNDVDTENGGQQSVGKFVFQACRSLAVTVAFLALALFAPAGDLTWRGGWLFILVFVAMLAASIPYLRYKNPEIFVARSQIHAGTKSWDKVVLSLLLVALALIFPAAGFDFRVHGSSVPLWATVVGYLLFSIGYAGSIWVYSVNRFAEPSVRIQSDRGQHVVDVGPYAIVRHPLYLASLFLVIGMPLALGSYWALIPVAAGISVLVLRTKWEDQTLRNELQGYAEYASRVRYRLIPGVW
jgi:protein-S-isoprenylcysteine O-methyltransferase Ste14